MVSNNCSERIKDFESKQWVYCDGLLRTKYKLPADDASSGRYYYIINDSIRPTSGFAMALSDNSIQVTKPAYLEKVDGNVYIRYEIKGDSGSGPNPGIYYFYENSDTCGGYIFQLFLNLVDDHFKWIVEPDLTKIQA